MKNGLAIWHYPHRTIAENVRFFGTKGFSSVSLHGAQFVSALNRGEGEDIAQAVRETGVILTVHYTLPKKPEEEPIFAFRRGIKAIAQWQSVYGLVKILSFDIPASVRDHAALYLNYVLEHTEGCQIAVEDYGLTPAERAQIEPFKGNRRFGYLVDLGHMLIRLRGKNIGGKPLFTNRYDECPPCDHPGYEEFMRAFASKEFPIFEIHLHNNDGEKDLHLFLEQGVLDIPMIARVVRDLDFRGVLTIESAPGYKFECSGDEADEGILKTFDYWKECCQKK